MPKKRKTPIEELVVPPQDHRICGTICVCQMTAILSSVAIVYLSVAIYFPSMRALYSGIIEQPVMCSTSKVITVEKCNWGSCGEWCLSKTSGACVQIYVNLRRNGSNLNFENCTNSFNKTCHGIDQDNVKKYRCKQEECKNLTGTFNCTRGICINITDIFQCIFHNIGDPLNCTGNRGKINCMDIEGLNSCSKGICATINEPYNCDRRCVDIPTRNKNVILLNGDRVFLSRCEKAIVINQSHQILENDAKDIKINTNEDNDNNSNDNISLSIDKSLSLRLLPQSFTSSLRNETETTIILASCYSIIHHRLDDIEATDCVNGTLINKQMLSDLSNFTFLHTLTITKESSRTAQEQRIAPLETDLLIANDSKLMINLEGCVNTLKEECKQFLKEYGKDGADHNAKARFPCYYSLIDPTMVVARFSLEVTYREFIPAAIIPVVLFVFSCLTLILCYKTVEVGDDAKMRFKKRTTSNFKRKNSTDTINKKDKDFHSQSANL
ncbi:hypothetical protein PGB90_001603 [Kerria lacca]